MNSECWHVETIETKQMYYVAILLVLGNKSLCNSHLCYIKTYNKVFKTKETLNLDSVRVIIEELCHKFDDFLKKLYVRATRFLSWKGAGHKYIDWYVDWFHSLNYDYKHLKSTETIRVKYKLWIGFERSDTNELKHEDELLLW